MQCWVFLEMQLGWKRAQVAGEQLRAVSRAWGCPPSSGLSPQLGAVSRAQGCSPSSGPCPDLQAVPPAQGCVQSSGLSPQLRAVAVPAHPRLHLTPFLRNYCTIIAKFGAKLWRHWHHPLNCSAFRALQPTGKRRGCICPEPGLSLQSVTVIPGWNPSQGQSSRGKDHGHLPAWKKRVPPSCRGMPNPGQIRGACSTSVAVPAALGGRAMPPGRGHGQHRSAGVWGDVGRGILGQLFHVAPAPQSAFPARHPLSRAHPERPVPVPTRAPGPALSRAELLFPPDPPQVLKIAAGALTHASHPPSEPAAAPGAGSARVPLCATPGWARRAGSSSLRSFPA